MADTLVTERAPGEVAPAAALEPAVEPPPAPAPTPEEADGRAWPPPRVIWWIVALHAVVLLGYTILFPPWVAVDEIPHVDLSHAVARDLSYPQWDERHLSKQFSRTLDWASERERSNHLTATQATPRPDRLSMAEMADSTPSKRFNQQPQHPPLYYAVTGGLARLVEEAPGDTLRNADMQGWFFRFLSVLMVAPLPLIIWAIAKRLRLPATVGVAAAIIPLGIPQFSHIMASANNDALIVPTVSLSVLTIIPLMHGDLSRRKALLAGGAVGLALFTKGMTVLLPFWGLAAIAWGAWVSRRAWRPQGLKAGLLRLAQAWGAYTAAVLACGGWWWVRNMVVFGHFAPTVDIQRFHEKAGFTPDPRDWFGFLLSRMDQSFWGRFGYGHVVLESSWIYVATAICLVALALAFRPGASEEPIVGRLLLLAVWPLLGLPPATRGYSVYAMSGAMPGMQGRYWFGAIAPLAVLAALGAAGVLGRYARYLPVAVAAGAVAMQVNAVSTILDFFWGSRHASLADRWGALLAWSPLPSPLVLAGVAIGAATVAAGLWRVAATARADGALA